MVAKKSHADQCWPPIRQCWSPKSIGIRDHCSKSGPGDKTYSRVQ